MLPRATFIHRRTPSLPALALVLVMLLRAQAAAGESVEVRRAADPQGTVEIVNVAGLIDVSAWDRPEVEVTGTTSRPTDKVDVTTNGSQTSIRVMPKTDESPKKSGEARLTIHVPRQSAVSASAVSADVHLAGVQGDVTLQTVSGEVTGEVGANIRLSTVSGDVNLTARSAKTIDLKTISGDISFTGGGGDVEVKTVSGDVKLDLTTVTRGRLNSVSGDISVRLALAPDAELEGQTISGTLSLDFPSLPTADFDVRSLSGDIRNCFGPKASESGYGPGSRLTFRQGEARARVRIDSKSGDVHLCTKGERRAGLSIVPAVHVAAVRSTPTFVF